MVGSVMNACRAGRKTGFMSMDAAAGKGFDMMLRRGASFCLCYNLISI